jgi:tape measure domain-containing protein
MAIVLKSISDSRDARQDLKLLRESVDRIQQSTQNVSRSFSNWTKVIAAGYAVVKSAQVYTNLSDTITNVDSRIRIATNSTAEFNYALRQTKRIANESRQDLSTVANLYAKISVGAQNFGASQRDILKVTSLVTKAVSISGSVTSEARAAVLQLGQAIGSGVLGGDELRSIRENAQGLAKEIAAGLGVTVGALKKMGEEGVLSSERVFKAILKRQKEIDSGFGKIGVTYSQAFTNLGTSLLVLFGAVKKSAFGSTDGISEAINRVANRIFDFAIDFELIIIKTRLKFFIFVYTMMDLFDGLWESIGNGVKSLGIDFDQLHEKSRTVLLNLLQTAKTLSLAIFATIGAAISKFVKLVSDGNFIDTFIAGFHEAFSKVQGFVKKVIKAVPQFDLGSLITGLKSTFARIKSVLATIFAEVDTSVRKIVSRITESDFGRAIVSSFKEAFNFGTQFVSSLFSKLPEIDIGSVVVGLENSVAVVRDWAGGVVGWFNWLRERAGEILPSALDRVSDSFYEFSSRVRRLVNSIVDSAITRFGELAPAIKASVVTGFGAMVGVLRKFKGIVSSIFPSFQEFVAALKDLDISSGLNRVLNTVKAWAKTVVGWFKWVYEEVIGHSYIPDLVRGIQRWFAVLLKKPVALIAAFSAIVTSLFGKMSFKGVRILAPIALMVAALGKYRNVLLSILGVTAAIAAVKLFDSDELKKVTELPGKLRKVTSEKSVATKADRSERADRSAKLFDETKDLLNKQLNEKRSEGTEETQGGTLKFALPAGAIVAAIAKSMGSSHKLLAGLIGGMVTALLVKLVGEERANKALTAVLSKIRDFFGLILDVGRKTFDVIKKSLSGTRLGKKMGEIGVALQKTAPVRMFKQAFGIKDTVPGKLFGTPIDTRPSTKVGIGPYRSSENRFPGHDVVNALPKNLQIPFITLISGVIGIAIAKAFGGGAVRTALFSLLTTAWGVAIAQTVDDNTIRTTLYRVAQGFIGIIDKGITGLFGGNVIAKDPLGLLSLVAKTALLFKAGRALALDFAKNVAIAPTKLSLGLDKALSLTFAKRENARLRDEVVSPNSLLNRELKSSTQKLERAINAFTASAMRDQFGNRISRRQVEDAIRLRDPNAFGTQATNQSLINAITLARGVNTANDSKDTLNADLKDSDKRIADLKTTINESKAAFSQGFKNIFAGSGAILGGVGGFQLGVEISKGMTDSPEWQKVGVAMATSFLGQAVGSIVGLAIAGIIQGAFVKILFPLIGWTMTKLFARLAATTTASIVGAMISFVVGMGQSLLVMATTAATTLVASGALAGAAFWAGLLAAGGYILYKLLQPPKKTGDEKLDTGLVRGYEDRIYGVPGEGYATGGFVSGPGTSTSDSIDARLSDGEFVVNARSTRRARPLLEKINKGFIPKFRLGGSPEDEKSLEECRTEYEQDITRRIVSLNERYGEVSVKRDAAPGKASFGYTAGGRKNLSIPDLAKAEDLATLDSLYSTTLHEIGHAEDILPRYQDFLEKKPASSQKVANENFGEFQESLGTHLESELRATLYALSNSAPDPESLALGLRTYIDRNLAPSVKELDWSDKKAARHLSTAIDFADNAKLDSSFGFKETREEFLESFKHIEYAALKVPKAVIGEGPSKKFREQLTGAIPKAGENLLKARPIEEEKKDPKEEKRGFFAKLLGFAGGGYVTKEKEYAEGGEVKEESVKELRERYISDIEYRIESLRDRFGKIQVEDYYHVLDSAFAIGKSGKSLLRIPSMEGVDDRKILETYYAASLHEIGHAEDMLPKYKKGKEVGLRKKETPEQRFMEEVRATQYALNLVPFGVGRDMLSGALRQYSENNVQSIAETLNWTDKEEVKSFVSAIDFMDDARINTSFKAVDIESFEEAFNHVQYKMLETLRDPVFETVDAAAGMSVLSFAKDPVVLNEEPEEYAKGGYVKKKKYKDGGEVIDEKKKPKKVLKVPKEELEELAKGGYIKKKYRDGGEVVDGKKTPKILKAPEEEPEEFAKGGYVKKKYRKGGIVTETFEELRTRYSEDIETRLNSLKERYGDFEVTPVEPFQAAFFADGSQRLALPSLEKAKTKKDLEGYYAINLHEIGHAEDFMPKIFTKEYKELRTINKLYESVYEQYQTAVKKGEAVDVPPELEGMDEDLAAAYAEIGEPIPGTFKVPRSNRINTRYTIKARFEQVRDDALAAMEKFEGSVDPKRMGVDLTREIRATRYALDTKQLTDVGKASLVAGLRSHAEGTAVDSIKDLDWSNPVEVKDLASAFDFMDDGQLNATFAAVDPADLRKKLAKYEYGALKQGTDVRWASIPEINEAVGGNLSANSQVGLGVINDLIKANKRPGHARPGTMEPTEKEKEEIFDAKVKKTARDMASSGSSSEEIHQALDKMMDDYLKDVGLSAKATGQGFLSRIFGKIQKFAMGGLVRGPGTSTSDSVPAMLSKDEFVVNAAGTKKNRPFLDYINKGGKVAGFARGTPSSPAESAITAISTKAASDMTRALRDMAESLKTWNPVEITKAIWRVAELGFQGLAEPFKDLTLAATGRDVSSPSDDTRGSFLRFAEDTKNQSKVFAEIAKRFEKDFGVKGATVKDVEGISPTTLGHIIEIIDGLEEFARRAKGKPGRERQLEEERLRASRAINELIEGERAAGRVGKNVQTNLEPLELKEAFDKIDAVLPGLNLTFDLFKALPDFIRKGMLEAALPIAAQTEALEKIPATDPSIQGRQLALQVNTNQVETKLRSNLQPFQTQFLNRKGQFDKTGLNIDQGNFDALKGPDLERFNLLFEEFQARVLKLDDALVPDELRHRLTAEAAQLNRAIDDVLQDAAAKINLKPSEYFIKKLQDIGIGAEKAVFSLMSDVNRKLVRSMTEKIENNLDLLDTELPEAERQRIQKMVLADQAEIEQIIKENSPGYKTLGRQVGEQFADDVSGSLGDSLKDVLKGKSTFKEGLRSLADDITDTIIDTFVDGLTAPLTKKGGFFDTLMSDIGTSIFGLGGGVEEKDKQEINEHYSKQGGKPRSSLFDKVVGIFTGKKEEPAATAGVSVLSSKASEIASGMEGVDRVRNALMDPSACCQCPCMPGMGMPQAPLPDSPFRTAAEVRAGVPGVEVPPRLGAAGIPTGAQGILPGETGGMPDGPLPGQVGQQEGVFSRMATGIQGILSGILSGNEGNKGFWGILLSIIPTIVSILTSLVTATAAAAVDIFATGGMVGGKGTGTSDSNIIRASRGEFIINAKQTAKYGELLTSINADTFKGFAAGGVVGETLVATPSMATVDAIDGERESISEFKSSSNQQVFHINITGDINRQTKSTIYEMIPQIANGVNSFNKEKGIR